MEKCSWCGKEMDSYFLDHFCSPKCREEARHFYRFKEPSDAVNSVFDIVNTIATSKQAKRAAREAALKAERDEAWEKYKNSPEYLERMKKWDDELSESKRKRAEYARKRETWGEEEFLQEIDEKADSTIKDYEYKYMSDPEKREQKGWRPLEKREEERYISIQQESTAKINQWREQYKSVIEKNWPIAQWGDRLCGSTRTANARTAIANTIHNFEIKLADLDYNMFRRSIGQGGTFSGLTNLLFALSALITIGGIIQGIKQRGFVLPVLGFIFGYVVMEVAYHRYSNNKEFPSPVILWAGCPYLLIVSIILGVVLHSFLFGLVGVIVAVVLFSVIALKHPRWTY